MEFITCLTSQDHGQGQLFCKWVPKLAQVRPRSAGSPIDIVALSKQASCAPPSRHPSFSITLTQSLFHNLTHSFKSAIEL